MFKLVKAEDSAAYKSSHPETTNISSEIKQDGELTELDNESELLESRLDEQTQLIMILKKSVQDTDAKCKRLEEDNQKLTNIRDTEDQKLKQQAEELALLNDRLKTMKLNYKELLALVKDYKSKNEKLLWEKVSATEENERLFLTAKNMADQQIAALTTKHIDLKNQCAIQEKNISEEKELIELKKSQYRMSIVKEKESHKSEMVKLMEDLQTKKSTLQETKEALEKEEKELFLEMPTPEDLLKLEVKNKHLHKSSLEENDNLKLEKRKTENFQQSIRDLDDNVKALVTIFEQKAAEVLLNEEVKELQNQIEEAKVQFEQTKEEIANFKKEAQQKLQEERELNKKLRHIH